MRSELCERLHGIIEKITYKPGWKIEVADHTDWSLWGMAVTLKIQMMVNSLHVPGKMEAFSYVCHVGSFEISNMTDGDIRQKVIRQALLICESHEMDEWLKYEGAHVNDPHPEIAQHGA